MSGSEYLTELVRRLLVRLADEDWAESVFDASVRELGAVASALRRFEIVTAEQAEERIKEFSSLATEARIPTPPEGTVRSRVRTIFGKGDSVTDTIDDPTGDELTVGATQKSKLFGVVSIGRVVGDIAGYEITALSLDMWSTHFRVEIAARRHNHARGIARRTAGLLQELQWQATDNRGNLYMSSGGSASFKSTNLVYLDQVFRPPLQRTASRIDVRLSDRNDTEISWEVEITEPD